MKTVDAKGSRSKLAEIFTKYYKTDNATVSVYRVAPELIDGRPCQGFTARWDLSDFDSANQIIEKITQKFGGQVWDCMIMAPNSAGIVIKYGSARILIDAPPKERHRAAGWAESREPWSRSVPRPFMTQCVKPSDGDAGADTIKFLCQVIVENGREYSKALERHFEATVRSLEQNLQSQFMRVREAEARSRELEDKLLKAKL